jgi:hypothetical protein
VARAPVRVGVCVRARRAGTRTFLDEREKHAGWTRSLDARPYASIGAPVRSRNSTPRDRDGERRFERRTETKPTCQLGRNRTPKSRLKIHKDVSETDRRRPALHLARVTMAALSSTVSISSAKALAPKAAKRAVAVKAAARADSNNEVRLPPETDGRRLRDIIRFPRVATL